MGMKPLVLREEHSLRTLVDTVLRKMFPPKRGKVVTTLTKHHPMKAYWGVEVYLHTFWTSALD
jgi:hypothetical protein